MNAPLLSVVANAMAVSVIDVPFAADSGGKPYATAENLSLALEKEGITLTFDEFSRKFHIAGLQEHVPDGPLNDEHERYLRFYFLKKHGLKIGKDDLHEMTLYLARRDSTNPLLQHLEILEWDGTARIDTWLTVYGGADDTAYTNAVGALTLTAAVRRARKPGTKFDTMLTLLGPQGCNKSSAVASIAMNPEWFTDAVGLNADAKVIMELIAGKWIVEIAELNGLSNRDQDHVKAMLSRTHDRARFAWDKLASEHGRSCIFIGTTNSEHFLRDVTGNRRFWPVKVTGFDLKALKRDRDQLWAEAVVRETRGDPITLPPELWSDAAERQEKHLIIDPWEDVLAPLLDGQSGKVKKSDLWSALGLIDASRLSSAQGNRLSAVMTRLGFAADRLRFGGPALPCYLKGNADQAGIIDLQKRHDGGRM